MEKLRLGWAYCKLRLSHLIGDCCSTSFWKDTWCNSLPLINVLARPLPENEDHKTVSTYLNQGGSDLQNIPCVLPDDIISKTRSILLLIHPRMDCIMWPHANNDKFSTASAFNFIKSIENDLHLPLQTCLGYGKSSILFLE